MVRLILASASPRRAQLLKAAAIEFDVIPADLDESMLPGEHPAAYARRLALAKALEVLGRIGPGRPVLAADTIVTISGEILGKPADDRDARRMLRKLSGRAHNVITAVCLASQIADPHVEHAVTTVEFAAMTDAEIDWYVATGEPADKAGAYAIQ